MKLSPADSAPAAPAPPAALGAGHLPRRTASAGLSWLLIAAGLLGLVAAFVLTVEKIALLSDPNYVPSCSINPVLSCGSVMITPQAEVFRFPNPLIGIVAFTVVLATGMALRAGATLARWYWLGLQIGLTAGIVFVHWLIFQSLYRIGALCPYCMVVWAVTIPLFWYVTLHNTRTGHLHLPSGARRAVDTLAAYHGVVLTGWYLLVTALIAVRFWTYWSTLL